MSSYRYGVRKNLSNVTRQQGWQHCLHFQYFGRVGIAQILAYAMSKVAIHGSHGGGPFEKSTLGRHSHQLDCILPGLIDTSLTSPEIMEITPGVIPLRRPDLASRKKWQPPLSICSWMRVRTVVERNYESRGVCNPFWK
jgi:hypothetical protein